MKKYLLSAAILFLMITVVTSMAYAEEDVVSGSASVGIFNKYVFRGYELSKDSAIIQPALEASYKGFSMAMWGNIDTNENATQSFAPDIDSTTGKKRYDEVNLNETDLTLSYTYEIDKLALTGGYIFYATRYVDQTEEIFVSATYDILLSPTLAIYRDINEYSGTYINFSLSHSIPIIKEITLDLGASAGYFVGDSDYWKTYESSTSDYTGEKYKAFHDGMIMAGFTIPIAKHASIQPVVQYWFPLSKRADREIDGNSYNINGKLDDTLVCGLNASIEF
ncbi:MAG: hypothetical protein KKC46_00885 [Proteobacteria bacterium]|nr:hypothetical protein [Pseudomonadota bacterium]